MKAIVFGGTGWLGHNIALGLEKAGYKVTVASRGRKTTFTPCIGHLEQVTIDKQQESAMAELLARRFELVADTVPTVGSIELIHRYARGVRHYIHCSSTGGYAPLPFVPCDETAPYGGFEGSSGWAQKAVVDAKVLELFAADGFPATVIRPCYITGGDGLLPLDNLGGRRADFIPDILAEKELELPNDGQALLQPIHVEDLAAAFVLAAQQPRSIAQRYNICLDHAVTLNKYMELNAEAVGKKAHIVYRTVPEMLQAHPGIDAIGLRFFATHMCFSIAKARCELGYNPRHTPEETIMETARLTALRCGAQL